MMWFKVVLVATFKIKQLLTLFTDFGNRNVIRFKKFRVCLKNILYSNMRPTLDLFLLSSPSFFSVPAVNFSPLAYISVRVSEFPRSFVFKNGLIVANTFLLCPKILIN